MDGVANKGLIGKGAFGSVYLVENDAHEQFAVKVMPWTSFSSEDRDVAENELKVLKELSHMHVLAYVDSFVVSDIIYIITEYCSGGDLSGFLDQIGKPVPEDLLLVWLWQMACGLEYMHLRTPSPVLHRDLKPSNIYLTDTGDIRLGDMGIARILDAPGAMANTFCGTPTYMSPEALYEKPYNEKTDVWSLGCCVVEMATLDRAFNGSTMLILRNAVLKMRRPLPEEFGRELDDIVSKMLRVDSEHRWSATEILDSPLLRRCVGEEPGELLERHDLMRHLAIHRRSSPTSTVNTLADSMSNLKVILGEGESIKSFRSKLKTRKLGRFDDSTLTGSSGGDLTTVLYKTQTMKKKTMKKVPSVPKKPAPVVQPPNDSLSRPVLSSFRSTLMQAVKKQNPKTGTLTAEADSSHSSQILTFRRILTDLVGQDSLREASTLVMSASSSTELLAGLAPLLGEQAKSLSNIVLYVMLAESIARQSSAS